MVRTSSSKHTAQDSDTTGKVHSKRRLRRCSCLEVRVEGGLVAGAVTPCFVLCFLPFRTSGRRLSIFQGRRGR